uniref:Uncharacterized protein n=1 Tax=Meloidogyne enterolobii TaxID=390850 RepID=A0A6V7WPG4_MELEN|nr:unnamed protein product [Meloidogyne enterolobii]
MFLSHNCTTTKLPFNFNIRPQILIVNISYLIFNFMAIFFPYNIFSPNPYINLRTITELE